MQKEIRVPDIGDFSDVDVIEVLVAPGDTVGVDDPLITLESDKASMDVPASDTGTVKEVKIAVGDKVSEGSLILLLDAGDGAAAEAPPPDRQEKPQEAAPAPAAAPPPPQPAAATPPAARPNDVVYASPSVRKLAREAGIDLAMVAGTGPKGRITREDVEARAKGGPAVASVGPQAAAISGVPGLAEVDFAQFGEVEMVPLTRIQKKSGPFLHAVWVNTPMVTHHDEADVTELEAFRQSLKPEAEKQEIRVTALSFIMKALAATLLAFPRFNSSLAADGEHLVYKKYVHIGVAVDTPNGLVVPKVRDVDQKNIFELSKDLGEISARAREGKLGPTEMQGGSMSISSLGGIGGTAFTPIVNAPEVAILGVTRSQMKPVWNGTDFEPRLMLPLDLTYDHRVIDGAEAARFMAQLVRTLSDIRRLVL